MLTYRSCRAEDCDVWIRLNRDFMAEEIQDEELWNSTDKADDDVFRKTFEAGLKTPARAQFLLFLEDDVPIGFANLMIVFSVWSHGLALVIDDLFLLPESRGKGYGATAMQMIERFAASKGCKRIQFHSEFSNSAAEAFYRAEGYTPADMKFYVKYLD